jgi:phospholipid/cholesterol/gamma-HCH transport system substrate-binding protein
VKPFANKFVSVGALVAVTGIAFLVAYTFFKKGGYSEKDIYRVHAYFTDATGLTWKSRVQIAGIQVGEVEKISLEGDRARLDLKIKRDVQLHTDTCIQKTFPSALLPDALIEVVPGTPGTPLLTAVPEGSRDITCVREATGMARLLDSLSKIAADVQVVTGDLAKTVGGKEGSLSQIVENVSRITRQLDILVSENGGRLTGILENTRAFTADLRSISGREKDRVHSIAVNIEDVTRELKLTIASLRSILEGGSPPAPSTRPQSLPGGAPGEPTFHPIAEQLNAPDASQPGIGQTAPGGAPPAPAPSEPGLQVPPGVSAGGVRAAVDRLNSSLQKLDDLLAKVSEGKSAAGKLLVDEKVGRDLGTAITDVSNYIDRLQKLQFEVNLRSEWLLNQQGAKTYFGARLLPRPDKYYIFEIVSDPRGVDTVTSQTVTTHDATTGRDTVTTQTTVLHEEKLTFSLEYGKRYGPIAFRVGIIESSGGAGTDLYLLNDALQLSLSVYQFNRPYTSTFPRAKVWANYYFLQHFYVTAGTDDFLNKWRSSTLPGGQSFKIGNDVFFGGGLSFTDDDIKSILAAGGASAAGSIRP